MGVLKFHLQTIITLQFIVSLLQNSTSRGIMSTATEQGVILMTMMNAAAQFFFSYYYFFITKR